MAKDRSTNSFGIRESQPHRRHSTSQGGEAMEAGKYALAKVTDLLKSLGYVCCSEGGLSASALAQWRPTKFDMIDGTMAKAQTTGVYATNCKFPISLFDPNARNRVREWLVNVGLRPAGHKEAIPLRIQSQESGGTAEQKLDCNGFRSMQTDSPIALLLVTGSFEGSTFLEEFWDRIRYYNNSRKKVLLFRKMASLEKYLRDGAPLPDSQRGRDFFVLDKKYADPTPYLRCNES